MSEGTVQEQVIARAMKDTAFRQELLSNPRTVLAREYHLHMEEEVSLRVLEEPVLATSDIGTENGLPGRCAPPSVYRKDADRIESSRVSQLCCTPHPSL